MMDWSIGFFVMAGVVGGALMYSMGSIAFSLSQIARDFKRWVDLQERRR